MGKPKKGFNKENFFKDVRGWCIRISGISGAMKKIKLTTHLDESLRMLRQVSEANTCDLEIFFSDWLDRVNTEKPEKIIEEILELVDPAH